MSHPASARLVLDEMFSPTIATALRDLGQDVAPQQPAVAMAVRCGDDVGDAVADAEAGHRQRLVQGRGPVIDTW